MTELRYTVAQNEGIWFQLWWDGDECVYSEDLHSTSREEAEKEAEQIAATSFPLSRVMEAVGCESRTLDGEEKA
jgi:hypothetical protein